MTTLERIKDEEGWRPHVYSDSLGFASIGWGFLIDPRRGEGMPKQVGEYWLQYNLRQITASLMDRWPPFSAQPLDVQEALTEMAYQLGVDGVLGFRLMLGALERGDRHTAATEALDSGWHEQTPKRAERVAAQLRGT